MYFLCYHQTSLSDYFGYILYLNTVAVLFFLWYLKFHYLLCIGTFRNLNLWDQIFKEACDGQQNRVKGILLVNNIKLLVSFS